MTPVQKIDGPPWWATVGSHVLAFAIGIAVALAFIAPQQRDNREAITPDKRPSNPVAQASVDHEREKRQAAERLLSVRDSALSDCMSDRSILQAVQGVNLPQVTSREASQ